MTSNHTCGSVTILHDFWRCVGTTFGHFCFGLSQFTWSQFLACVFGDVGEKNESIVIRPREVAQVSILDWIRGGVLFPITDGQDMKNKIPIDIHTLLV